MSSTDSALLAQAQQFVSFLNKSVTPFHAVEECVKMLSSGGYTELRETEEWKLTTGGKYFVRRNKSALIAFAIGGAYKAGNGFSIVAAHTDSPCLRVKPISKLHAHGCLQVGVTTYGGGIWRSWFDRDLGVAGRIFVKKGDGIKQQLVKVDRPILYLPSLCIHLDTEEKFSPNKEEHIRPILATDAQLKLNSPAPPTGETVETEMQSSHSSTLLTAVATAAGCAVDDVVDLELYLYDTQPAAIGGVYSEFISGARLDNLVGAYTAVRALLEADSSLTTDAMVRVAACYDNEECGSDSAAGAGSALTQWVLQRVCTGLGGSSPRFEQAMANSYMISADQAHAVHPNYSYKHEQSHRPMLHGGVVVKINVNQRYATTPATLAVLRRISELAKNSPLQKMIVRNDSRTGSTIGPIMSTHLGMRTIDVGLPQWAMHSIRELCCTSGISQAISLYSTFYKECDAVLRAVETD